MTGTKQFKKFVNELIENRLSYATRGSMRMGIVGSGAVDDGTLNVQDLTDGENIRRLNAFIKSVNKTSHMDIESIISNIRTKLYVVGLTFPQFDVEGDAGGVTVTVDQYGHDLSDVVDGGLYLDFNWETEADGLVRLDARLVSGAELDMEAQEDGEDVSDDMSDDDDEDEYASVSDEISDYDDDALPISESELDGLCLEDFLVLFEETGDKEEFQKFFNSVLKKFGVESPKELEGDKKKEFYDYIDKNWKSDDEEESKQVNEATLTNPSSTFIAQLTGTRADAVDEFINTHNLDGTMLYKHVKLGGLPVRMDFTTALAGKDGNKYQVELIKKFQKKK